MTLPENFVVSGTPEQLAILLPLLEAQYQFFKNIDVPAGGGSSRPLPVDVKGKIYIKLYFKGIIRGTASTHRTEKSFRLMHDDPKTISLQRLTFLANQTKTKFNNFTFTTGHDTYTYNEPAQGFNRVFGHFSSESDARRLFEQLLDIPQLSPKWERLTKSIVVQPGNRFQDPPEKVIQANVSIRADRERPIANMTFSHATIKFPHIRNEIDLVDRYGNVLQSLAVIEQYTSRT
jgi:hypothetical protein